MLKVIELFAGVGSQTQALKNIGVEHEVVGIAEIDKYAISSYMQLHGDTHNFGDISKIENLPGVDLWTYSFPCQDLSVAGKGAGIKEGTRSGLLLEVERLLEVSDKPKYLLMENVKNLVGKKNKPDFDRWCQKLEELGYKNYWQVLNAKDYGIPQNRERVFMVSILGEHTEYIFPVKEELKLRLGDMLEEKVEEKYFINKPWEFSYNKDEKHDNNEIARIKDMDFKTTRTICDTNKLCRCLDTMGGGQREPKILVGANLTNIKFESESRIYKENGLCPTLLQRDCKGPKKILIKNATKKGYLEANVGDYINLQFPKSETRRGRVQKEVAATLMCNDGNGVLEQNFRIRKLTPLECWRLMGWKDEQFNKIQGISNSQLYKQAGNGIVVTVLEKIFEKLFK